MDTDVPRTVDLESVYFKLEYLEAFAADNLSGDADLAFHELGFDIVTLAEELEDLRLEVESLRGLVHRLTGRRPPGSAGTDAIDF